MITLNLLTSFKVIFKTFIHLKTYQIGDVLAQQRYSEFIYYSFIILLAVLMGGCLWWYISRSYNFAPFFPNRNKISGFRIIGPPVGVFIVGIVVLLAAAIASNALIGAINTPFFSSGEYILFTVGALSLFGFIILGARIINRFFIGR